MGVAEGMSEGLHKVQCVRITHMPMVTTSAWATRYALGGSRALR